jgi:hypothetical protein
VSRAEKAATVRLIEDLLFVLILLEGSVCLAAAYAIALLALYGFYDRLPLHLGVFGGSAAVLLLTSAVADGLRGRRQRQHPSD